MPDAGAIPEPTGPEPTGPEPISAEPAGAEPSGDASSRARPDDRRLRHSARAILLDEDERILLCRFDLRPGLVVWAAPGGGVEPGESLLDALARELDEELGVRLADLDPRPPLVWRETALGPEFANPAHGWSGVLNSYFLLRARHFEPRGSYTDEQLRAENITELRWWTAEELRTYAGEELFGPRSLPTLVTSLLTELRSGTPRPEPLEIRY